MSELPRIAVLVSGTGRSLDNLARCIAAGELEARLGLVISSRAGVRALELARDHGIPGLVIDAERDLDVADYSSAVFGAIREHDCSLVVLAGFLRLIAIPDDFAGRVINIHPSLLPAFGGKGYYGDRVHRAVLARGVGFTGCTVHFVTNEYDEGPIILQRCIDVAPDDSVESLAARVFEQEKIALPEALRRVLSGLKPPA